MTPKTGVPPEPRRRPRYAVQLGVDTQTAAIGIQDLVIDVDLHFDANVVGEEIAADRRA